MPLLGLGVSKHATAGEEFRRTEGLPPQHLGCIPTLSPMATIYFRNGTWYINFRADGRQVRVSLGTADRKEAETLRAKKEAELRGLITTTRGVTVGTVLTGYMKWYATDRPKTYGRAVSALKRFRAAFDDCSAEDLAPAAIETWASSQTATGQAEKALKLARAALRRAVKQRTIRYSAMDGVSIQKPVTSRAPSYYRPADLTKLAKAAGDRAALWSFMTNTGIRRGEMAKARRADVRDGMLYVESAPEGRTKNLRWRAVPLNTAARAALVRLGDEVLVEAHPDTISDWFSADAKAAGLPGSLHWLRHTFCTAMVQSGVSLHEVKRLAGHSSITVTEKYAHHMPDFGRAAVGTIGKWQEPKKARKHTKKHTRQATSS